MYIHSYSRVNDSKEITDFINANGFAIMVSNVDGRLWASHIPLVLSADGHTLTGHLSRGNNAWRALNANQEVLCIFQGAHAYISSSWYDHENVPTWNYLAAQVRGTVSIISETELVESLKDLTHKYEQHSEKPVTVEGLTPSYLEKEMKGIVGIRITITQVEASFKLSQNRDDKNHQHIVDHLQQREDGLSNEVAQAMKKVRGKPASE
jgi:transcriptional regulator